MKMHNKFRFFNFSSSLLLLLILGNITLAQQFKYKTKLDSVAADGFYSIALTPDLSSLIKTDFSDIRITDEKNMWIPHILNQISIRKKDIEKPLKIISNDTLANHKSAIVIENISKKEINHFLIELANIFVNRTASLSGSDNNKDWYIIKENLSLDKTFSDYNYKFSQQISFPVSKYTYFKLVIDNEKNDPLNVLGISTSVISGEQISTDILNNNASIQQKDSGKISIVHFQFDKAYHHHTLLLKVSSPKYFKRRIQCFSSNNFTTIPFMESVIESSEADTSIEINFPYTIKSSDFFLFIINDDNPPLKIEKAVTTQPFLQLIAYLEKNHSYSLLLNDSAAPFAQYDLIHFKNIIPSEVHSLKFGRVENNPLPIKEENRTDKKWIWPVLLGILVMMIFFTIKLTKEVNKK